MNPLFWNSSLSNINFSATKYCLSERTGTERSVLHSLSLKVDKIVRLTQDFTYKGQVKATFDGVRYKDSLEFIESILDEMVSLMNRC